MPDPSPADAEKAIGQYTLPSRDEIVIYEDPTPRADRRCSFTIPIEMGEPVLDTSRLRHINFGSLVNKLGSGTVPQPTLAETPPPLELVVLDLEGGGKAIFDKAIYDDKKRLKQLLEGEL